MFQGGKKRSLIWDYFDSCDKNEASCKTCSKRFKTPTGTTTCLKTHLKNAHLKQYNDFNNKKEEQEALKNPNPASTSAKACPTNTIQDAFEKGKMLASNSPRAKQITRKIGLMICKDYQPYSIVEDEGFRDLINELEPRYQIPDRTHFSRTVVPNLREEIKAAIAKSIAADMEAGVQSVSYTTDGWTSRSCESYLSLTCHYMRHDFTIASYVLATSYFPKSHTADNLREKLEHLEAEWNIPSTIPIYTVTDNARNIVAAIQQSKWEGISCFAHTLQLAIKDAKKETSGLNNVCTKGRAIVGHFRKSSTARAKLLSYQIRCGAKANKLIQDVETRWNSEYDMLERLVEQRQPLTFYMSGEADAETIESMSSADWKLASGYVTVLKPLKDATTQLSGQAYPTLPMVIPILFGIHAELKKFIGTSETGTGIMLARNLIAALSSRFPNLLKDERNYVCAMLLDPRFKAVLLSPSEKDSAIAYVKEALVMPTQITDNEFIDSHSSVASPVSTGSTSEQGSDSTHFSLWNAFEELARTPEPQAKEPDNLTTEITQYLNENIIPRSLNPLQWWRENSARYPKVSLAAKRFLCIPATQVASEQLFSKTGNIVSARRECLSPEHVEQLVFVKSNYGKGK